jgi:alpha-1,2-mannosyltransferase
MSAGDFARIESPTQPATDAMPLSGSGANLRFVRPINIWLREFPLLTAERAKFFSGLLLLACTVGFLARLAQSHGLMVNSGHPIGGDFVDIYAASIAVLKGQAASVYDVHRHYLRQLAVLRSKDCGVLAFEYPPVYLLMVMPLSKLPFVLSWVVFETLTFLAYLFVLRRIARAPLGLWLAATFPAVINNFMCGQNGFLTTALMGAGLLFLEEYPLVAGVLFGLMIYKPQFAVLVPVALIVSRQWRALVASAVSAALFSAASLAVLGAPVWHAFMGSISYTQKTILERGAINYPTLQTAFGAIKMWGWQSRWSVSAASGGCVICCRRGDLRVANAAAVFNQGRDASRRLANGFAVRLALRPGAACVADRMAGNGRL